MENDNLNQQYRTVSVAHDCLANSLNEFHDEGFSVVSVTPYDYRQYSGMCYTVVSWIVLLVKRKES
jgi:hypothetical protein